MTPKARRQQQLTRESATRSETEAAIEEFKAGRSVQRPTRLVSKRKTRKHAARCYGCDASGFPLKVWEYHDVESGPSILCYACSTIAERDVRPPRSVRSEESGPGGRGSRRRT